LDEVQVSSSRENGFWTFDSLDDPIFMGKQDDKTGLHNARKKKATMID
jgi:hypothetical protein